MSNISRRDALRRGAIVGGAVFAVPTVQVLGLSPASAQQVSGPPPTSPTTAPPTTAPPEQCQDISNIQIVVSKGGVYYGLKWDGGWDKWSSAAPDSNDCIAYYESATGNTVVAQGSVADTFNGEGPADPVVVQQISPCVWRLILPLPSGYTYVQGYMKFGDVDPNSDDGKDNCPTAGTASAGYIEFSTV
jgi:hypothetical protein